MTGVSHRPHHPVKFVLARAVRRRRRAADRMSASRRRRFREVFTSRCTPAIMLLDFCNAVYNEA